MMSQPFPNLETSKFVYDCSHLLQTSLLVFGTSGLSAAYSLSASFPSWRGPFPTARAAPSLPKFPPPTKAGILPRLLHSLTASPHCFFSMERGVLSEIAQFART